MPKKKRTFRLLTKYDVWMILIICTLATVLNVYHNPFLAATVVVGGLILRHVMEFRDQANDAQQQINTPEPAVDVAQPDTPRTINDIITAKLQTGTIERAIDAKIDTIIDELTEDVLHDVFSPHGEVAHQIRTELTNSMLSHVQDHDFSQYNTKLDHVMTQLVANIMRDQEHITQAVHTLLGTVPMTECKTHDLFKAFTSHLITKHAMTDKPVTCRMDSEDIYGLRGVNERKTLNFTCEEDASRSVRVIISRPLMNNEPWRIEQIQRIDTNEPLTAPHTDHLMDELTAMHTPIVSLRHLNAFELQLLKLYYDKTPIVLGSDTYKVKAVATVSSNTNTQQTD